MKYLPVFLIFTFFLSSLSAEINEPVRHQVFPGMILPSSELVSRTQPSGDEIVSPAQFDRVEGVLLAWSGWDQELIRDISYVISQDDCVYMLVSSIFNQAVASSFLQAGNVNMDNVYFIIDPDISGTSMWIRDYGPFYIYEDGVRAIVDFFYGVYWGDDDIPFTIAAEFDLDIYESNLMHHGGNHISDGNGMAFCTTNIFDYNPSYSQHDVRAIFKEYLGIDSLVVIDKMNSDGTGHIDMFCKLLSDTLFIVGEYAIPE
ncbi:MAG: agmatine deiminase family protein, partial [Candidatus Cloacimonetes bacterium]|nr:agmatine deiminase family protein [Candidatus Cloacimonadota bacterium]